MTIPYEVVSVGPMGFQRCEGRFETVTDTRIEVTFKQPPLPAAQRPVIIDSPRNGALPLAAPDA